MVFQPIELESIPQARYLSAENYLRYRAIMRLFYLEHQQMRYQLDKEALMVLLRGDVVFSEYSSEQLVLDLDQLVNWKNLTAIQDPHKVYTVADFKNRQYQYMMTQAALEVERMTITLENLSGRTAGLSATAFRRINEALQMAGTLDKLSAKEVCDWWQDLHEDFDRLSQNHQDYLREFYGPGAEKQMKSVDFISHKQHLIRYLEEFIRELQRSSARIRAKLESFSQEQTQQILTMVDQSRRQLPQLQSDQTAQAAEALRQRDSGVWHSLLHWFVGEDCTANYVLEVTNEIIRRVVQNAALLVQMQNMGVSNKAEIRQVLGLFAMCETLEDAHRLSSQVFGVSRCRHFAVTVSRQTDRIDSSTFEEPPQEFILAPRVRTYKPRLDRSGFADKSLEKAAGRQKILQDKQDLQRQIEAYIQDGVLDFDTVTTPVPPQVRAVLLSWIATANLSPDKCGITEYGKRFTLRQKKQGSCRLPCTDGQLTMPCYELRFEEVAHV